MKTKEGKKGNKETEIVAGWNETETRQSYQYLLKS